MLAATADWCNQQRGLTSGICRQRSQETAVQITKRGCVPVIRLRVAAIALLTSPVTIWCLRHLLTALVSGACRVHDIVALDEDDRGSAREEIGVVTLADARILDRTQGHELTSLEGPASTTPATGTLGLEAGVMAFAIVPIRDVKTCCEATVTRHTSL